MTQVAQNQPAQLEYPTANGAFRAARIAFVHALWHAEIVREAHAGFVDEMAVLGVPASAIEVFETPGSFEIPLHAQTLARTGRYAAIVAAGFVVDTLVGPMALGASAGLDGGWRTFISIGRLFR